MTNRKPNLFLIGAMKSGTTYLCRLLDAHPTIFMCDPEEPSYFVDPRTLRRIWPDMWERGFWRSEQNYLDLFEAAVGATILGEASTNYTKRPLVTGVAERIHAFNPTARFIYVMRDPVERTLSHYWHMVRYHGEGRALAHAIRCDPQYLAVSDYAMQLAPFMERFGADRIITLTHENLVQNPAHSMQGLYDWLGVDTALPDMAVLAQPANATPETVVASRWRGLPRRLKQSPPLRGLFRNLPRPIETALSRATSHGVARRSVDTTEAVAYLLPIQRRQTEALSRLLDRGFPEWTTLNGVGRDPADILQLRA